MPRIEIEVELNSFSDEDLVDELEGRGYDVSNSPDLYDYSDNSDFGIDIDFLIAEHHYGKLTSDELVKKLYDAKGKCWCKK